MLHIGLNIKGLHYFPLGNKSLSALEFYETSFSLANNLTNTSCCSSTNKLLNVTCGSGLSCAGQCSALGASLCPTGNCTGNPQVKCLGFGSLANTCKQTVCTCLIVTPCKGFASDFMISKATCKASDSISLLTEALVKGVHGFTCLRTDKL